MQMQMWHNFDKTVLETTQVYHVNELKAIWREYYQGLWSFISSFIPMNLLFIFSFRELVAKQKSNMKNMISHLLHACMFTCQEIDNMFMQAQNHLKTEAPIVPRASLTRWSLFPLATCSKI